MKPEDIRSAVMEGVIDGLTVSLDAQLRALKRLRGEPAEKTKGKRVGMSQVDMVEDILKIAGKALHVNEILERVEKAHGVHIDRESIVSSLTKKIAQGDRFVRSEKNTFGLKEGGKI